MKLLDLTWPAPAENLAADEALLDQCEASGEEVLRFWEAPQPFVVVGYANRIEREVNVSRCHARGVPILRRCSGGGTVVQAPGCLNYAVLLRVPETGPLTNVTGTNQFVMERNRAALERLLGAPVSIQGHTDLALPAGGPNLPSPPTPAPSPDRNPHPVPANPESNAMTGRSGMTSESWSGSPEEHWRKFSGNAQRRRRSAVLFHGTILYAFDLSLLEELLPFPSRPPDYRNTRRHLEFVTNIPASAAAIRDALRTAWNAAEPAEPPVISPALKRKYVQDDWRRSS